MLNVEVDGPLLRLTLARPEVRNAIDERVIAALREAFEGPARAARVVVLTGEGEAFCAGGDLNWMRRAGGYTEEENAEDALRLARVFQAMLSCPAVVVARVRGPAFGGGCGLVAAADVALADKGATFAFSEVRLGLVPATISSFVLPKIGPGHARALFTTGEAFRAERALTIGLVHEVVEGTEALDAAVEKRVKAVLAAGPEAVAASKRIAQERPMPFEEAARLLATTRAREEAREGIAAFLEKRKASYVVER